MLQGAVRSNSQRESVPTVGVLIGACLHDRARRSVAGQLNILELKMVRPAVDPFDDRIRGAPQFVMEAARHQPTAHGIAKVIAMYGKTRHIGLTTCARHDPMHGLDDVATDPEFAKRLLEARLQRPASRSNLFGQTQTLEFCGSAEQ